MSKENKPPKVFISYTGSTPEHEARIVEWAGRLVGDGVDAILDKWHLKEGQDKNAFMEKMVSDPQVSKVLIFTDRLYFEKANELKGRVETDSQIISQDIYKKVGQQKFLPIVCEKNEQRQPFLPIYLKNRIYFDFSNAEIFHEEYVKLIRAIFDKPVYIRPSLGQTPDYILEDDRPLLWPKPLVQDFKKALFDGKSNVEGQATSFLDKFYEGLEEFRVTPDKSKELDDQVYESIQKFLPFRDCLIDFMNILAVYREDLAMYERVFNFFEKCLYYLSPPQGNTEWQEIESDNYRFYFYELFIYLVAIMIKNKRFEQLMDLFSRRFLTPVNALESVEFYDFTYLCLRLQSLENRNKRLKLNKLNLTADLIKERATVRSISFENLMEAEGILFLRSLFQSTGWGWYPNTFMYAQNTKVFPLFARAAQKQEFEKLFPILGVSSKLEFLKNFEESIIHSRLSNELRSRAGVQVEKLFGVSRLGTM